jgi:hypothetical protein
MIAGETDMADTNNVESFTLGAILVLLAFFLLDKKLSKIGGHAAMGNGSGKGSGANSGCGCGSPAANSGQSEVDQPIPIGGQPLNPLTSYPRVQGTQYLF